MIYCSNRNRQSSKLALLGLLLIDGACLDTASKSNDGASSGVKTASPMSSEGMQRSASGAGSAGVSGGGANTTRANGASGMSAATASMTAPMQSAGTSSTGMNMGAVDDGEDAGVGTGNAAGSGAAGAAGADASGGAAGATGEPPTGTTGPNPALVAGTGTSCASYTMPAGGKCGSYFCGVDLPTLTMASDPTAVCGNHPELTCDGTLVVAVGTCARQVKSENLLDGNDALRPKIQACVFEDATIMQKVAPECVACYVSAAICAGDNCLTQCLAGDSPGCDTCRKQNSCEAPLFECGGLPSPF